MHTATIITARPSAIPAIAILMAGEATFLFFDFSPLYILLAIKSSAFMVLNENLIFSL